MAVAVAPQPIQGIVPQRGVRLTPTEIKVLSLIAQGHSSKEAADRLVVSKRTVDFHLANIYDKLQVNNRIQAVRNATRLCLIPFEPFFEQDQEES
ncbi:MAG: helix-turn-helix transcriptional regulator [Patescibacteria group bacterium]